MTEAAHAYMPPSVADEKAVSAQVARYLDGTNLLAKTQALRLSTVDAAGWPHASLLSAGESLQCLPGASASWSSPNPRLPPI